MSCIFKIFGKKKPQQPEVRIENPLNLDELPENKVDLEIIEGALMDILVSLHYRIEQNKLKIRYALHKGSSNEAREYIAKVTILKEKKQLFEKRLERVRSKLQPFREKSGVSIECPP